MSLNFKVDWSSFLKQMVKMVMQLTQVMQELEMPLGFSLSLFVCLLFKMGDI